MESTRSSHGKSKARGLLAGIDLQSLRMFEKLFQVRLHLREALLVRGIGQLRSQPVRTLSTEACLHPRAKEALIFDESLLISRTLGIINLPSCIVPSTSTSSSSSSSSSSRRRRRRRRSSGSNSRRRSSRSSSRRSSSSTYYYYYYTTTT